MNDFEKASGYRWGILALATLTNALVVAAPSMAMPVLFGEISAEMKLSLVQVGTIWGISALPSIFTSLLGGAIGDRFGPKRILIASCLAIGLFGALRGMAEDFFALAGAMISLGLVMPFITTNTLKTCGAWFPSRQLGLASGVLSMGMALGFLIGSMLSATVLSPLLGGWRQVFFLYGGIALVLCIPWLFTRPVPVAAGLIQGSNSSGSLSQAIVHVARLRNVWLFGLAILGIGGCVQGTLGYLPLYLRGIGWSNARADGALSAFHMTSLVFTIPIAFTSDKSGSRRKVLAAAGFMIAMGVGLLSLADGWLVWIAIFMAGMVRDGFMGVFMTSIMETEGVGFTYAGTAIGVVMIFSGLGNLFAPPLGNSLAGIGSGIPFAFWAVLAVIGIIGILATQDRRPGKVLVESQHLQEEFGRG